jgi:hypothetical protein
VLNEKRQARKPEGVLVQRLDSLGIHPKKTNDLNDSREMSDLVENVKQTMFQEYMTAYTE